MNRRNTALRRRILPILGLAFLLSPLSLCQAAQPLVSASSPHPGSHWRAELPSLREAQKHSGPFRPSAEPSLDGSPVEYLILTNETLKPQFERLAAWKTQKGVPAVVRTLSEVESTGLRGSDLAETIRNYIREAYLYWGVRFVLLAGDSEIIPIRHVKLEVVGLSNPISEMYYSCLDGDWNADGDAFFGEAFESATDQGDDADLVSEVYLGRAPVSNVAEASLFVDKTLLHEKPQVTDFQDKILLLAEVLFPTDYEPDGNPPPMDGAIFAQEIVALLPPWMQATRLYEASEFWPGSLPLNIEAATQEINAGYGTVVHIGHGYRYTLSVGNGSLDVGDADSFTNAPRAGLFYLLNCTATAFDFESMAEALLLNPDGGATVVVGAAREAFPIAARDYQRTFFSHVLQGGERRVGVAMTRSREEFVDSAFQKGVDRWTQLVLTLLGDPELPLFTRILSPPQVQGIPAALQTGAQTLALTVSDTDGPLDGALVCAFKADDEYRVARTDALGQVEFALEPNSTGDVLITVTAVDHQPLEITVPVISQGIGITLAGLGLQDDGGASGVGNLDGRFDAGETVTLQLPLQNTGDAGATGISATLVSDDPAFEVLQASSTYPDLAAGVQADATAPFVLRVTPETPDGSLGRLRLELQHAAGNESREVELLVHSARLRLLSLRLDDTRAGNGNGVQEANEEIDLYYSIENRGTGTAVDVHLQLVAPSPGLEILNATAIVSDLLPGMVVENSGRLSLREVDVQQSRRVDLVLEHLQGPSGQLRSLELRPPQAPGTLNFVAANEPDVVHLEWQPSIASDVLGYNVYRALTAAGPYEKANIDIVQHSYFLDQGLAGSKRYHYKVSSVDSALVEGPQSVEDSISTNPPQLPGWPLSVYDFTASSPAVGDLDADGILDVVAAAGQLFAWDETGVELLDADNNAFTWGVFFGVDETFTSVAIADLDREPGKEIIAATWNPEARFVAVVNGGGESLPGWPQPLVPAAAAFSGAQVAPVVANLDQTGAPEILLAARDGRLYAWHADGTEVADGDADPSTHGVFLNTGSPFLRCAPGVADLDPTRPGLETAIGSTDGKLHVLDATGQPLPGWPRSETAAGVPFGALFASGITIADLDQDGVVEMIFLESDSRLHAMHLDGNELSGFPISGIRATSQASVPSPAIADLVGDDKLEIVVASSDGKLQIYDWTGQALWASPLASGAVSESSPLIGDIDGDGALEILLGNEEGVLGAWNLDGTLVEGFPIVYRSEVRATPTLTDLGNDEQADLVVQTWDGSVFVLGLSVPWNEASFPWSTYRGNPHRTGEYGFDVPTPVQITDLLATYETNSGVRLSWHHTAAAATAALRWRVYRSGPFGENPLLGEGFLDASMELIGEIDGRNVLEYVDPVVNPGAWYVYGLGVLEQGLEAAGEERLDRFVAVQALATPSVLRILPNVPNPFNPQTRIQFEVPTVSGHSRLPVRLALFEVDGRRVRLLVRDELPPGSYSAAWDGRDDQGKNVGSGIYVVKLLAAGQVATRKVTLLR